MFERFRGHFERQRECFLTPELAKTNPEAYKGKLIELLHGNTVYSGKMWDYLCQRGICSRERFIIDPEADEGSSSRGIITLGAQPWPEEEMRELTHTGNSNFTGDRQYVYRMSHEISHIMFTGFRHEPTTKLFNSIIKLRNTSGLGFSSLGGFKHYAEQGTVTQSQEDVTELVNKYLIDPRLLSDFLQALSLDGEYHKQFRRTLGLTHISHESAGNIFSIVEGCVRYRFQT